MTLYILLCILKANVINTVEGSQGEVVSYITSKGAFVVGSVGGLVWLA